MEPSFEACVRYHEKVLAQPLRPPLEPFTVVHVPAAHLRISLQWWHVNSFTTDWLVKQDRAAAVRPKDCGGTVALTTARSLALSVEPDEWREFAACRDTDPDLFFPVGTTGPAIEQIANAKAVCAECEVAEPCLEFALNTNQDSGIWGGTSEDERRQIRRRRAAARRRVS
ncbi:MAG: WhiB family transcriptional regulator [Acidimicrobiales bacterium]|nr:WhiB family transcriptional regulator [Acidimicrobiales bacterium]